MVWLRWKNDAFRGVALCLIILVAVGAAELFVWSGLREKAAGLEEQHRVGKMRLQAVSEYARWHPEPEKPVREDREQLRLLQRMMPVQADTASFISHLEQMALSCGTRLLAVRPSAASSRNEILATPIEVALQGDYFSTLMFFRKLEATVRQLTYRRFEVQVREQQLETRFAVIIYSTLGENKQ